MEGEQKKEKEQSTIERVTYLEKALFFAILGGIAITAILGVLICFLAFKTAQYETGLANGLFSHQDRIERLEATFTRLNYSASKLEGYSEECIHAEREGCYKYALIKNVNAMASVPLNIGETYYNDATNEFCQLRTKTSDGWLVACSAFYSDATTASDTVPFDEPYVYAHFAHIAKIQDYAVKNPNGFWVVKPR